MPLKRQLRESEILIFNNAYIHQRSDYWQLYMWLEQEGKYALRAYVHTVNQPQWSEPSDSTWESLQLNSLAKPTSVSQ